jgi:general secretion pathway protein A
VALLIDDAHHLRSDVLQEIELLSNLETRTGKLLQVVFAARPEFEVRLGEEVFRGLLTRLTRRFRLGPLTEEETVGYLELRLRQRKLGNEVVPKAVLSEIHKRARGIPRLITTLYSAAIERREEIRAQRIDLDLLERVAYESGM